MSSPTVLMAGGGTGGHVFPLVAVAHALVHHCPEIRPIFVGTARGMETRFVPAEGFELELLDVLPIRGRGVRGAIAGATRAAALLPESRALLRKTGACAVFSVGGYAAGPVSLAARTLGLPVALAEPNSVIGLANRLLAPFVQRAYLAFEQAESHFSPAVVQRTGVPLRPGFDPRPYRRQEGPLRILVLGGSQGAKSLNEVLPRALASVEFPLEVVHQCGKSHSETVTSLYDELAAESGRRFATVTPFISDMPQSIGEADLVVARSGASAVSEIAAVGRPSILIPYPHASGDHQRVNAEALSARGAAVCVENRDATVQRMAREVTRLAREREVLRDMARAATRLGRPHAADDIALDFLALAGIAPQASRSRDVRAGSAFGSNTSACHLPRPEVA